MLAACSHTCAELRAHTLFDEFCNEAINCEHICRRTLVDFFRDHSTYDQAFHNLIEDMVIYEKMHSDF